MSQVEDYIRTHNQVSQNRMWYAWNPVVCCAQAAVLTLAEATDKPEISTRTRVSSALSRWRENLASSPSPEESTIAFLLVRVG